MADGVLHLAAGGIVVVLEESDLHPKLIELLGIALPRQPVDQIRGRIHVPQGQHPVEPDRGEASVLRRLRAAWRDRIAQQEPTAQVLQGR